MQECGECTLCCRLLEIKEANSLANEWCENCNPKKGCKIYKNRPKECHTFNCSWKLDDNAHFSMRPDMSKIIFENLDSDIVFGTIHPEYKVKKRIWDQVSHFIKSGSSVILQMFENKHRIYLADGAEASEIWDRIIKKRDDLKNDTAQLHN